MHVNNSVSLDAGRPPEQHAAAGDVTRRPTARMIDPPPRRRACDKHRNKISPLSFQPHAPKICDHTHAIAVCALYSHLVVRVHVQSQVAQQIKVKLGRNL